MRTTPERDVVEAHQFYARRATWGPSQTQQVTQIASPKKRTTALKRGERLPPEVSAELKADFNRRQDKPYPKEHEKKQLEEKLGICRETQDNWFVRIHFRVNLRRKKLT